MSTSIKRGSALISALFIVTLVAIAATAMSTRLRLDIYRTQLTLTADDLYLASQSVSFWAIGQLTPKEINLIANNEGKVLIFPPKLQSIYPGVIIEGAVYDLQSRFNLNNLADKKNNIFFVKLLENTNTGLPIKQRNNLANAINEWVSPYKPGVGNDEFVNYYLKQKPPYSPSQQLMNSVSELRLVMDVDQKLYLSLEPFMTTLPESTPINLNNAPKALLKSLGFGLTDAQLNELLQAREENGYDKKKIGALLEKLKIKSDQTTLDSEYFLSVATVKTSDITLVNFSILQRKKDKKDKVTVTLIKESLNSF